MGWTDFFGGKPRPPVPYRPFLPFATGSPVGSKHGNPNSRCSNMFARYLMAINWSGALM